MAEGEIFFQGKKFVSLRRASELTGYAKDYVGQLCRLEKIKSERVGRDWFVDVEDLLDYKKNKIESIRLEKKILAKKDFSIPIELSIDEEKTTQNKEISSKREIEFYNFFILSFVFCLLFYIYSDG